MAFGSSRLLFSRKKIINNVTRIFSNAHIKNSNKLRSNEDNYSYSLLVDDDLFKKLDNLSYKYRFIKLQNELEVFLISSPEPTNSMAILNVKVGAFLEPDSIPGLAHYLEHMLFTGTEEYPEINDIKQFIELRGGFVQAHTYFEKMQYIFGIEKTSYQEALIRFSSMFKNPLFNKKYMKRELFAIENEFNLFKSHQPYRVGNVLLESINRNGLKFFVGNMDTLKRIPESNRINVRNEMINFFNNEYSSNRMVLLLAGNHSLDELTEFATKYFSGIKNKKLPVISYLTPPNDKYISNYLLKKIIIIDSLKYDLFLIFFPLEISLIKIKYNAALIFIREYISEGNKSLKKYLFDSGFIYDIYIRVSKIYFENFLELGIHLTQKGEANILLILEFLFSVFKLLSEIEPNMKFYENLKKDLLPKFKNKDDLQMKCNEILTNYLKYECKPEDILIYKYSTFDFEENIYDKMVSQIKPENMLIVFNKYNLRNSIIDSNFFLNFAVNSTINVQLLNNSISNSTINIEAINEHRKKYLKNNSEFLLDHEITLKDIFKGKYSQIEYVKKELNPCLISYLSKIREYFTSGKFKAVSETEHKNQSFSISNKIIEINRKEMPVRLGHLIEKSIGNGYIKTTANYYRFYKNFLYYPIRDPDIEYVKFILNFEFPINKIYFNSKLTRHNVIKLILLHQIFEETFRKFSKKIENLSKYLLVTLEEYSSFRFLRMNSFYFEIATSPDQISEVMTNFANYIKRLHFYLNNSELNLIKNKIMSIYSLNMTDSDYEKFYFIVSRLTNYNYFFSSSLILEDLKRIEIQEVIEYIRFLVKHSKISGFVIGNIKELEIAQIMESFMQIVGRNPSHLHFNDYNCSNNLLTSQKYILNQMESIENLQILDFSSLKPLKIYYFFPLKQAKFENNVIFFDIFIGSNSIYNRIFTQIFIGIINSKYYQEMRTKRKLAYAVEVRPNYSLYNNPSIQFLIVSYTENIKILSKYTLNFWSKCCSSNSKFITESNFQISKDTILKTINSFPKTLNDIELEFTPTFYRKEFDYNWREKGIRSLGRISFEEFKTWLKNLCLTSTQLMYAFQSTSKLKKNEIKELSRYVPHKFTRKNFSKSLFDYPDVRTYSKKQLFDMN